MKIEIWSDIMCPFCYIGKRQLETALAEFPNNEFEIEWKSFQLDPTITPQSGKDVYTFLAERKGISVDQSIEMHKGVVERAKSVGLDYHFDKAIISNSLTAHRIIHLAKTKNLGDEMEEIFFKAYFTEGRDLNNKQTLIELGTRAGLDTKEVQEVVENEDLYLNDVHADIHEANQIGVQGVPFFVFDRKYAVSGAQPIEAFVQTIKEAQK
ncbi:DsbA family oxidoreductase [Flavobacterium hibernum]|uniref:DSBA oxidoreductase n=1 Tax=Flavobacterium hibernum TaxID=37752 RepID=A0A0D0F3P5_9FLAO|nr:DsbA family oxidoreductase [Flavobacterium hibernum]KIO52742.1 DSBA oxidoreductase [Flavobacterium hibernum]OXA84019.1 disulfide bond formation protein DsbA [Flavobacterium hibernum]STO11194.1 Protein-disulfide isomerase [Flavobacterium hibernum]